MKLGTKSVLVGAHAFWLHPFLVAYAWWRLYGFPRDPRLWLAFFVHDLGYLGAQEMDDDRGERHVELGARIMRIFGQDWHDLCLYHSRFYAKRDRRHFSRLCVADKLVIAIEPWWLYLPRVRLTGEVREYMATYGTRSIAGADRVQKRSFTPGQEREWHATLQTYMRRWVEEHRDGRPDTWTNRERTALNEAGVWQ